MAQNVSNFQDLRTLWLKMDDNRPPDEAVAAAVADGLHLAGSLQQQYLSQMAAKQSRSRNSSSSTTSLHDPEAIIAFLGNASAQARPPPAPARRHFRRNTLEQLYALDEPHSTAGPASIDEEEGSCSSSGPATPDISDRGCWVQPRDHDRKERTGQIEEHSITAAECIQQINVYAGTAIDGLSPKVPKSARLSDVHGSPWDQQESSLLDLPGELLDVIFAKCHPRQQLVVTGTCRALHQRWMSQRNALLEMVFPPISMTLAGQFTMFEGCAATLQLRVPERDPTASIHQARLVDRVYLAACPPTMQYTSFFVSNNTVRCMFPSSHFEPTTRTLLHGSTGALVQIYTGRRGFEAIDVILVPVVLGSCLSVQLYITGLQRLEPQEGLD